MKTEKQEQLLTLLRIAFVIGFAFLYSWGGIENKWLRRFVAPLELSVGMFVFSRDWKVFLQAPIMMATLSLGYGADVTWLKILKRMIWGLANGASSAAYMFYSAVTNPHLKILVVFQVLLVISGAILLGVFNPLANARAEEFTIGVLISLFPMMFTRRK